jgi:hypothetical protein
MSARWRWRAGDMGICARLVPSRRAWMRCGSACEKRSTSPLRPRWSRGHTARAAQPAARRGRRSQERSATRRRHRRLRHFTPAPRNAGSRSIRLARAAPQRVDARRSSTASSSLHASGAFSPSRCSRPSRTPTSTASLPPVSPLAADGRRRGDQRRPGEWGAPRARRVLVSTPAHPPLPELPRSVAASPEMIFSSGGPLAPTALYRWRSAPLRSRCSAAPRPAASLDGRRRADEHWRPFPASR